MERVVSGLAGMDPLIEGGFPGNTVILLSGSAGTGKTLFGLNFAIKGASLGEKSYYITFNEGEEDLIRACQGIGLKAEDKNLIMKEIVLGRDVNVKGFIETVEKYPEIDRLVIDNLNKLLLFAEDEKDYRYQLTLLVKYLREKVKCSILICETDNGMDTGNGESFECDGVLHLSFTEFEEKPLRTLRIDKLRYTSFE
ncbi:MAG: ATPase domain-containing protein, partial [Desulfatiglandales bacterium]